MKINNNLLSILSIITIFVINTINAFDTDSLLNNKLSENVQEDSANIKDENYYMIFVNNGSSKDGSHSKREEVEQRINSIINEVTNLIIDNKDTYENLSVLEKFEQKNSLLRKRDNNNNNVSDLAYDIFTLDDRTIIYSYLSNSLVKKVEKIPNVIACVKDRKIFFTGEKAKATAKAKAKKVNELEKFDEIINETQWSGVSVRENADIHLSILSQGKYDGNSTRPYDKNYYYPSSAGSDVDIFIFDSGFNFRHSEFANKDERTVKCATTIINAKVIPSEYDDFCEITGGALYHGLVTSDLVGGLTHGVAPKANIYGIAMLIDGNTPFESPSEFSTECPNECSTESPTESPTESQIKISKDAVVYISTILVGLKYVNENLLRPNKAVVNFSFGIILKDLLKDDRCIIDIFRDYIDLMSERGTIFVAAAGNEANPVDMNEDIYIYPCIYDNVICVGAIENVETREIGRELEDGIKKLYETIPPENIEELTKKQNELVEEYQIKLFEIYNSKIMNPSNYRNAPFSNFGKKVGIYAPGYAEVEYIDKDGVERDEIHFGTSVSAPIVAGVIATIMSEHPEVKYSSTSMLDYLTEIGEKDIIEGILEGNPNVFLNNGKHSLYSGNDLEEENENENENDISDEENTVRIEEEDENNILSEDENTVDVEEDTDSEIEIN